MFHHLVPLLPPFPPVKLNRRIHVQKLQCVWAAALLFGLAGFGSDQVGAAEQGKPGLLITFTATDGDKAGANDTVVSPNVSLYVPAGNPPTPFLCGGKFSADWTGFVFSEIR